MIHIKSTREIEILKTGGKKLAKILDRLLTQVEPGVQPLEIDNLAKRLIAEAGGSPSFMTVGNYQWATCISVNEGVVHGVPTSVPFKAGDIVGVDVGLLYQGYHTDTSWTKIVNSDPPSPGLRRTSQKTTESEVEAFLKTGERALAKAIAQARPGNRIGHISQAIQETIEGGGYSVVPSLVGHGIGKKLHEAPQIPGVITQSLARSSALAVGMTLAIEVIYAMGEAEITYGNDDGWSLVTRDRSLSGLFEHTIVVTDGKPLVLTRSS